MTNESLWCPLTERHYSAIGRVVVQSAILEGVFELAIWQTLGVSPREGDAITGGLDLEHKRERFFEAARQRFQSADDQTTLRQLKSKSGIALANRRRLVHGFWAYGISADAPLLIHYREAKKRGAPPPKPWSPDKIELLAQEIEAVGDAIIRFLEDHGISAPPLCNRPRP